MARTALAIALGVVAALAAVIGSALVALEAVGAESLLVTLAVVAIASVGVVLAIRVPANAVGWLLIVSALCLGVEFLCAGYAERSGSVAGGSWPGTVVAVWLYSFLLVVPVLIMTMGIPLIYPDGHLLSPRWRWLVAALVVSGGGALLEGGFASRVIPDTNVVNPFYIAGLRELLNTIEMPAIFGLVPFLGAVASVVVRYRRGNLVERQQLKWLIAATAIAALAWSLVVVGGVTGSTIVTSVGWVGGLLAFTGFPVAIGIAVLRYRLYDIDRIISRTIAWALVTGVLVSVFAVVVIALQATLAGFTQGDTLAVAVSTLLAAALFQPIRRRVQHLVDRRFDRATYDAQRMVEAFAERLRDEVALDAVVADLHQTVATSIMPTSLGLWLRPTPR
jgi:hypothetical protein